jgi:hypothetical protein
MNLRKNKILYLAILFFFLSMFIFVFLVYLKYFDILEKREIQAVLKVGEIAAINLNNSTFSFGTINSDASSSRRINIQNNYSFPIIIHIFCEGNISQFLLFEKKIKLLPSEEKVINFDTSSREGQEYGNYSGTIFVVFKREI